MTMSDVIADPKFVDPNWVYTDGIFMAVGGPEKVRGFNLIMDRVADEVIRNTLKHEDGLTNKLFRNYPTDGWTKIPAEELAELHLCGVCKACYGKGVVTECDVCGGAGSVYSVMLDRPFDCPCCQGDGELPGNHDGDGVVCKTCNKTGVNLPRYFYILGERTNPRIWYQLIEFPDLEWASHKAEIGAVLYWRSRRKVLWGVVMPVVCPPGGPEWGEPVPLSE
jgi:hypothetical protein